MQGTPIAHNDKSLHRAIDPIYSAVIEQLHQEKINKRSIEAPWHKPYIIECIRVGSIWVYERLLSAGNDIFWPLDDPDVQDEQLLKTTALQIDRFDEFMFCDMQLFTNCLELLTEDNQLNPDFIRLREKAGVPLSNEEQVRLLNRILQYKEPRQAYRKHFYTWMTSDDAGKLAVANFKMAKILQETFSRNNEPQPSYFGWYYTMHLLEITDLWSNEIHKKIWQRKMMLPDNIKQDEIEALRYAIKMGPKVEGIPLTERSWLKAHNILKALDKHFDAKRRETKRTRNPFKWTWRKLRGRKSLPEAQEATSSHLSVATILFQRARQKNLPSSNPLVNHEKEASHGLSNDK